MGYKHGHTSNGKMSPEYASWYSMKQRCLNKKHEAYHYYGGRGITICKRWLHSFENFLADMGKRPSLEYSINRRRNNGNYTPTNCYWATVIEQNKNRSGNHFIKFKGERMIIGDWAVRTGISIHALRYRIIQQKWSIEKALTTPLIKVADQKRNATGQLIKN